MPMLVTMMAAKPQVRASGADVFQKGKNYANIQEATAAGLIGASAPFPEGLDILGFCNGVDGATLQRYREAEVAHSRVCMLATVGFLVGEQVEGSSFLFDAQVTGPAVNHFQQVPLPFWFAIGSVIAIAESARVQAGWQDPGQSDKLFLLKDGYTPGDLSFDPLGLGNGKSAEELDALRLKELNNGRLAMIAISGMVAQELVDGLNILPADIALELGNGDLQKMEQACAGKVDEAACAKAFEASLEAASRM
ncbi:Chlorophyll A-B binding protein, plant [Ostreococcus tauri]|uniref:Chlorophyll a-b binding protein, chloroplastic n=1 Tax=Ostreococcus tauri TaxID=70448 RepID=Q019J1_OSTTA|nr:Chlorophyll A-B binding protein, plant [Ostreococcus tauri]OUS48032.1 fucoxanthin chlorophyll a/c binding protein [Ostreococcus tauri]CAL53934.1 Chlorophyll A-B binding protein, plant [Ostreococcus tauri]|eukprot:XP_003079276.1 Chlorophyll A-B binding protein, plant [Ostreococcus tauri]